MSKTEETIIPKQHPEIEKFLKASMRNMRNPSRVASFAVFHCFMSVLTGRVYHGDDADRTGTVTSITIQGRTGIGKDIIRKQVIKILMDGKNRMWNPIGGSSHTSVKNFWQHLQSSGSVFFPYSESGESDLSKAGDMTRVRGQMLSLSTNYSVNGFCPPIAQNTKKNDIPMRALYSPAVTILRDTVPSAGVKADMILNAVQKGDAPRKLYLMMSSEKSKLQLNQTQTLKLNKHTENTIKRLHKNINPGTLNCTVKVSVWLIVKFDFDILAEENRYINEENKSHGIERDFSTRLCEKAKTMAMRNAIFINPKKPTISIEDFNIAIETVKSCDSSYIKMIDSESVGIHGVVEKLLDEMFKNPDKFAKLKGRNTKKLGIPHSYFIYYCPSNLKNNTELNEEYRLESILSMTKYEIEKNSKKGFSIKIRVNKRD